MAEAEVLRAPLIVEYPFTRTTGPVIGAFFTALREGFIVGITGSDGRVLVPPAEFDPVTSAALTEIVEVGDAGEVLTWAWVTDPQADQPLDRPFAWALIKLDGADTAMLHAVDTAGESSAMATGMRVKARWLPARPDIAAAEAAEAVEDDGVRRYREGHILDISCFEPEEGA